MAVMVRIGAPSKADSALTLVDISLSTTIHWHSICDRLQISKSQFFVAAE